MDIHAPKPGWAEQYPEIWWEHVKIATGILGRHPGIDLQDVEAVGISYQMHGLVVVDRNLNVLRPSIIWCDSRAVEIGEKAADTIGRDTCLENNLNFPGNFTASKLAWIRENEPDIFSNIFKAILPGDWLAMRLTGIPCTTESGLSEGILWDFTKNRISEAVLDAMKIPINMIPEIVPTFGVQGMVTKQIADELGLKKGTPVSYRAGDQPNNALSLNVLNPGEIATTAGTSGVVYGVTDKPLFDPKSRVNTFLHVNNSTENPRNGILLCINGTGILNRWLKNFSGHGMTYDEMNKLASNAPVGSDGLVFIPYGNGAERTLENRNIGASIHNLNFNVQDKSHIFRAAQEGIVFAMNYGVGIMREMGIKIEIVRAGHANMFLSPIFREAFANTIGATLELYSTDGSQGAARGAGIGSGIYIDFHDAFKGLEKISTIKPETEKVGQYSDAYNNWLEILKSLLDK
jgi:xylulokinase